MMRKFSQLICLIAFLLVPLLVGLSSSAGAVDVFGACSNSNVNGGSATDVCNSRGDGTTNPFITFIKVAITIMAIIIGVAAVIVIIVSGLTFVTGGSDPQAVARARSGIIYALVGLAIAGIAETLVRFVLEKL